MDNHPVSAAYPAEKKNGGAGSGYPGNGTRQQA